MIYTKINPIMRKYYLQKKAEAKKGNQAIANKIQIFANAEINKVVENKAGKLAYHEGKAYNNPNTLTELININKPKIDKEYSKLINSPKTSDTFYHQIQVQNRANDQAKKISQAQYEQIQKNIKAVEQVIDKYGIKLEKYRELNEKYPKTISRKGIITESIENKNYITSLGKNIVPHFDGYRELSPLTEHLHRQAQNQASEELARAENEEAIANGQDPPNDEKKWIWTGAGVTTRHQSNDGQIVPIDDPFIIVNDATGEVDEMMYPLDPAVYSSNTFICYCEVEYGHFSENKFGLTTDMIQAFDNAIKNLTIEADTHPMKVDVENNYFADEVETWAYMSDKIQDKDIKLATELLTEYSKVTNLEALPVEETFQVLQNHYKLQTINELGTMTKKFNDTPLNEKNSFTKLSEALELVKKQAETLQIVEPAPPLSVEAEITINKLKENNETLKTDILDTDELKEMMEAINSEFFNSTYGKSFTKEEVEQIDNYVKETLNEFKKLAKQFKETDTYYDTFFDEASNEAKKLNWNMKSLKEKIKEQEQAEHTITETTEAINNLVEQYEKVELQQSQKQNIQDLIEESNKIEQNITPLELSTKEDMDFIKGDFEIVTIAIEEKSHSSHQLVEYVQELEEMFKDDSKNISFKEKEVKQIEKYVDELEYQINSSSLELKIKEGATNTQTLNNINDAYDYLDNIKNHLNDLKNNARKEQTSPVEEPHIRDTVRTFTDELKSYMETIETSEIELSQLRRLTDEFKDILRTINRSPHKLTDIEINKLSQESNNLKKAIEQNIQENDYLIEREIRVQKDKIPDERIIRKCKDLLEDENINFKHSQNIAQGKATISYLKRFEPIKPSQKIINKFNKQKPFTDAEINHLTENVGELRYLMELCDQAVIEGGSTTNYSVDYRPVGLTENCEHMYGREPLDHQFDKYDDMIHTWVSGSDGRINRCRDYIDKYGEEKAREEYTDYYVDCALQVKELGETIIPQAYTSYRGNRNSPHILDNLIGDSVGETDYKVGMRYRIGKDLCTSITEEGTSSFSGLVESGKVYNVLITMLHPPKTKGNYLDNKSGLRGETELILTRDAQMQLLLFDKETDTYLVWECYD